MSPRGPETLSFRAMGCGLSLAVEAPRAPAAQALARVEGSFRGWERRLSRFRPDSELSALNRAPARPVRVSRTLWDALRAAVLAAEATDGLVTPTVLEALEAAGYEQSFETLAQGARPRGAEPAPVADFRTIGFDEARRLVTLPPGLRLDLGGTAKGWAADRAAARLGRLGPALVDAGGDIAVGGTSAASHPWSIAVEAPLEPGGVLGVVRLERGGVATSGRQYRRWRQGDAWQHHLIDPATRRPAVTDVLSATVVGPGALVSEVAAKRVLLMGSRAGLGWIDTHPALAAVVVLEDGTVRESWRMAGQWTRGAAAPKA